MLNIEEIDPKAFRKALNALKELDPTVTKALRAELKTELAPYATKLANQMPEVSPLKGMNKNMATGYRKPKGKVSFTPGSSRSTASRLLAFQLDSGDRRGFYLMELAGTQNKRGYTDKGRIMIDRLNKDKPLTGKRGGRYGWRAFLGMFGDVQRVADGIINKTLDRVEKELG